MADLAVDEPAPPPAPTAPDATTRPATTHRRFELAEAIILAVATVLTAWSAFQATKWSGVQADSYSRAAAARAEAVKAEADGDSQANVDVETFLAWLAAFNDERQADPDASRDTAGVYQPDPTTLSGFLHNRFRAEFLPAFDAWIAQRPIVNPEASGTPFDLPEYRVAAWERSAEFEAEADAFAAEARQSNQRGDNYVLVTVLFASVMFFAGVASKMDTVRAKAVLVGSAVVLLVVGLSLVIAMPKTL